MTQGMIFFSDFGNCPASQSNPEFGCTPADVHH
jgi:hypothetical protein